MEAMLHMGFASDALRIDVDFELDGEFWSFNLKTLLLDAIADKPRHEQLYRDLVRVIDEHLRVEVGQPAATE